jgi:O-antigen/teichoic acid export membrane protein
MNVLRLRAFSGIRKSTSVMVVLAGNLGNAVATLLNLSLLTRFLDPAVYGALTLSIVISTIASLTVFGPLAMSLGRYYSVAVSSDKAPHLIAWMRRISLVVCAGVLLVSTLAAVFLDTTLFSISSVTVLLMGILTVATGFYALLLQLQIAMQHRLASAIQQTLLPLIQAGGAVLACVVAGWRPEPALFGFGFGTVIVCGAQVILLRQQLSAQKSYANDASNRFPLRDEIVRYATPFVAFGFLAWASNAAIRAALVGYAGLAEVGMFNSYYLLAFQPFTLIGNALSQYAMPIVFNTARDVSSHSSIRSALVRLYRVVGVYLLLSIPLLAVLTYWHRELMSIVLGEAYLVASHLTLLFAIASTLFNAGQLLSVQAMLLKSSRSLAVSKILASCVSIAAAVPLVKSFGMNGAVWALCLQGAVFCASSAVVSLLQGRDLDRDARKPGGQLSECVVTSNV